MRAVECCLMLQMHNAIVPTERLQGPLQNCWSVVCGLAMSRIRLWIYKYIYIYNLYINIYIYFYIYIKIIKYLLSMQTWVRGFCGNQHIEDWMIWPSFFKPLVTISGCDFPNNNDSFYKRPCAYTFTNISDKMYATIKPSEYNLLVIFNSMK